MNGIRVVQKGDAPKEGITSVQASADSVVLDDDFEPIEPGSGVVGRVARGGNIPLGYYNDPEKTAEVFVTDARGNRWSIPGDYATVEADGRITLLGRGSVSINSGGEKVYPEEVEGALKSHPDVFDVLVVGVTDERWGERVTALVQPRAGRAPDARRPPGALPRRRSRATRCRARCSSSTRCRACRTASPTTARAKTRAGDLAGAGVGSLARSTHGELGGTGLRGWMSRPPAARWSGRPATDPSNLLRVMPAEGGTCSAARSCWPAAIRCPRRSRDALPAADLVVAADSGVQLAARLGLHVDRIVGDLDSADPEAVDAAVAAGRGGRTAPGREGCNRSGARDRRGGARRCGARRRRGRRRRSPRPSARQPAAARVARLGRRSRSRRSSGPCHGRARRHGARADRRRRAGSLVTLLPVGGAARGIVTDGLQYPLGSEELAPGTSRGVSNVMLGDAASVDARRRARCSSCTTGDPTRRSSRVIVDIEVVPQPLGHADRHVRARRGRDRTRAGVGSPLRGARARHHDRRPTGRRCGRCCGACTSRASTSGARARHHRVQDRAARRRRHRRRRWTTSPGSSAREHRRAPGRGRSCRRRCSSCSCWSAGRSTCAARGVADYVLPPPSRVWTALVDMAPDLGPDVRATMTEATVGLFVAAVAGVGVRAADRGVAVRPARGLSAARRVADDPGARPRADLRRVARLRAAPEGRRRRARRLLPDRRQQRRRPRERRSRTHRSRAELRRPPAAALAAGPGAVGAPGVLRRHEDRGDVRRRRRGDRRVDGHDRKVSDSS